MLHLAQMISRKETTLDPPQRKNLRMILKLARARSHSEPITGSNDDGNANLSKSTETAVKTSGGDCEEVNGIESTEKTFGRRNKRGRPVSLEDKPQPPDDERRCRRADGKGWRCANLASEDLLYCEDHCLYFESRKRNYAGTVVESNSTAKSGVVCSENVLSQPLSQVSHPGQHENTQQNICNSKELFSQEERECFSQFSELALLEDIRRLAEETFGPVRVSCTEDSKTDVTTGESEQEKENTSNFDSSSPLWSQILLC